MERTIMLSTVRTALQDAYEKFRNLDVADVAAPDDRTSSLHPDPQKFGLVATLTDGTQIALGDTDIAVPMTTISKAPIMLNLLTQYKPKEIAERLRTAAGAKTSLVEGTVKLCMDHCICLCDSYGRQSVCFD